MSVPLDFDDGAKARRERVLAVCWLRRGLERFSTAGQSEPGRDLAVTAYDLTRELEELISALDRRAPRVEQVGEAAIARDAAALRAKAVDRLAELASDPVRPSANDGGDPIWTPPSDQTKNPVPDHSL